MSALPKLPKEIAVDVTKGESGVLLARLPVYDVFTEADTLNELFIQVNDLIYAFFDVPQEYQDKICYIPPRSVQGDLMNIAEQQTTKKLSEFNVTPHYDISILDKVRNANV
jgi:hypothetical protein